MNNEIWFTICNLTYSSTKEHFPLLGCVQNLPPSQPIELCSVNSTEIVPFNSNPLEFAYYGPPLPFGIFDHCMVKLESGFIFIIGGHRPDINSTESMKSVWIADVENGFELKAGPPLGQGIAPDFFLCGSYQNDAGGTSIFLTFTPGDPIWGEVNNIYGYIWNCMFRGPNI